MDILALGIGNLVGSDVLILALIVAALFGAKRLPEIARNIGQGLNEFLTVRIAGQENLSVPFPPMGHAVRPKVIEY
jgi:TatA/E family protein of Tat protein translocase